MKDTILEQDFLTQVYNDFHDKIYRFIYYKTYNNETTEDLTSKTFLKFLEHIHRFDKKRGTVGPWLYRIARNVVIDFYRSKKHTLQINDVWDIPMDDDFIKQIENKEQYNQIKDVIKDLPSQQREIVILRIWEDLPYKEVSKITGKSEANCKMIFSRTMSKLRTSVSMVCLIQFILASPINRR